MNARDKLAKNNQVESLCLTCKRVCNGGCSWSKAYRPVRGWSAIPTRLKLYRGKTTDSYLVRKCPKYVRDDREEVGIYDIIRDLKIGIRTVYKCSIKELNAIARQKKVGFHIEVIPTVDNTTEFVKVYD